MRRRFPLPEVSVAGWVVAVAALTTLGADLLWVVALGDLVRESGAVPDGIPFASADQVDWPNPIVLAQVVLSLVHDTGRAGLAALQLVLVAATLAVLVHDGRRMGGGDVRTTVALALGVVASAAALVIVRLPSLSLLPFVLLALLLRGVHEEGGRRLWWAVPLVAVWGNLHGGVLVGCALLGVHLVLSPGAGSLARRVGVGAAALLALVVTPAGIHTPRYYLGVLGNEAAARGTDLWAAPSLRHPLDVAMLAALAGLLALAARRRMPVWEWVAVAGLAVATLMAARNGVWLALLLVPAAAGDRRPGTERSRDARPDWWWPVVAGTAAVVVLASSWLLTQRGDAVAPRGSDAVAAVSAVAAGRTVLADEPLAETLAQGGVRVWAANPLDAFTTTVQGQLLDFLHDARVPADADIAVVVVSPERADDVTRGGEWVVVGRAGDFTVLERSG